MSSNKVLLRPDELKHLKPWIKSKISSLMGYEEETIESIAIGCLERNMNEDQMKSQLKDLMEDSANPFVDQLFEEIPKAKEARKESKRKRETVPKNNEKDTKKAKIVDEHHKDSRSDSSRDRRERDKDRDRDRHSSSSSSSSRHRRDDRDKDREKEKDREKDREKEKEKDREKDRGKEKDKSKPTSSNRSASSSVVEIKPMAVSIPTSAEPKSSQIEEVQTTTEPKPASTAASALLSDMSSLLSSLSASKQALQQSLDNQKRDQKSTSLLKQNLTVKQLKQDKSNENTTEDKEEKLRRMSEKLQEKLAKTSLPSLTSKSSTSKTNTTTSGRFVPPPLLLDEKGREIDEKGNLKVVPPVAAALARPIPTKKVSHFDPNLSAPKTDRPKRSFAFHKEGSIVRKAEKQRAKVKLEDAGKVVGDATSDASKELTTETTKKKPKEPIPIVEWWDKFLLTDDSTYGEANNVKLDDINIYVEHPVPLRPPGEKDDIVLPMYLTKKEQKRLRKRTRMEREKERQERVLLGDEEEKKTKVKISNIVRVLGAESSADPTQIEQEVKKQVAERIANHDARNQARKLTKEERKEKKRVKLEKDVKKGVNVALFRINDISDPKHKFKIDANARALQLNGCAIIFRNMNLIVVEGGEKSIKKFKKLMKKIDWNKTVKDEEAEKKEDEEENEKKEEDGEQKPNEPKQHNQCDLIWEGTILKSNFQQFRYESFPDEDAIRKFLLHRWSEHYWDICKNYKKGELVL